MVCMGVTWGDDVDNESGRKREKLEIQICDMKNIYTMCVCVAYMYTSDASVLPEVEKKNMIECGWEGVERVGRARGVRLELFVSEAAANLSKNMFDPFSPRGVNRPSTLCCGGTAQTVNRIFIILQRWHFPVIFSFYDHFSSLALIRRLYCAVYIILLSPYSAEKTYTAFLLVPAIPRIHTHTHKSPSASFLTCKMTWKLNPLRPAARHSDFFRIYKSFFYHLYCAFLTYDLTATPFPFPSYLFSSVYIVAHNLFLHTYIIV